MGQYHVIINLTKNECIRPHAFGDGAKLLEWGHSAGGILSALEVLLAVSNGRGGGDINHVESKYIGYWGGDRIAIVGDYVEAGDLPAEFDAKTIYSRCTDYRYPVKDGEPSDMPDGIQYKDISGELVPLMEMVYECVIGRPGGHVSRKHIDDVIVDYEYTHAIGSGRVVRVKSGKNYPLTPELLDRLRSLEYGQKLDLSDDD